jgi:hypothetical protein
LARDAHSGNFIESEREDDEIPSVIAQFTEQGLWSNRRNREDFAGFFI